MGSKLSARIALLAFITTFQYAAEKRDWREGTLVSVDTTTTSDKGERRYECVVRDVSFSYTMEYQHSINAPVHRPIKFVIEKDTLILLDSNGKERPAHIERRERIFNDAPSPPRL